MVVAFGGLYAPQANFAGFQDDAYMQLINEVTSETDPVRATVVRPVERLLSGSVLVQQVVPNPEHLVAQANVHGLGYDMRPGLVLGEVWMA